MPCTRMNVGGIAAIVCTRAQRKKRCGCGGQASLLCDWKVSPTKTCDAPICTACAEEVATDKHLCRAHQAAYAAWKTKRGVA
jgi:hypothetical protein